MRKLDELDLLMIAVTSLFIFTLIVVSFIALSGGGV